MGNPGVCLKARQALHAFDIAGRTVLHKGHSPDEELSMRAVGPLRELKAPSISSGHIDPLGNIFSCQMPVLEVRDANGRFRSNVWSTVLVPWYSLCYIRTATLSNFILRLMG
jgi:hypothetical protein